MGNYIVEEIPDLRGYAVEWAEDGQYYLSRLNEIFFSTDLKPPFQHIVSVKAPGWKAAASRVRLAQRLLRFMVTNVIPLTNGDLFVTFDKSVGIVRDGKYLGLKGLARPCRVLRSACAADKDGNLYFGEYLANTERGEMRIYGYKVGSNSLETVYTFPANSIRHIHGLYFDEFTDSILCLTGDADSECRFLRTQDSFKTLETVAAGEESWRAVSVLFGKGHFYYGTDAEFHANSIYRVNRSDLDRDNLGDVNGTVFYSTRLGRDLFFTTTAENAPSQVENVAALWHVDEETGRLEKVVAFPKDGWHKTLFMFGSIHFPCVSSVTDKIYFNLVGVKGDNRTYVVKRVDE